MAWIEVHQGILRHRKTVALAEALDVHRTSAAGHIIGLWLWALDNAPTGDLSLLSASAIAIGAEWEGEPESFVKAIIEAGFIDQDGDSVSIHDWSEYAGRLMERRQKDAERKRNVRRTSAGHPQDVRVESAATVPHRTVPDPTEPKTEEKEAPTWLSTLREIPGWESKGHPHEASLIAWAARKPKVDKPYTEDQLEAGAIALSAAQTKTLKGYTRLDKAFQTYVRRGFGEKNQDGPTKQRTDRRQGRDGRKPGSTAAGWETANMRAAQPDT